MQERCLLKKTTEKKLGLLTLPGVNWEPGETHKQEKRKPENSALILGVDIRENLDMADGFFKNDKDNQLKIIKVLRKYKPEIILCNAPDDRHPDHGRSADLVKDAAFLSGLKKIETDG